MGDASTGGERTFERLKRVSSNCFQKNLNSLVIICAHFTRRPIEDILKRLTYVYGNATNRRS